MSKLRQRQRNIRVKADHVTDCVCSSPPTLQRVKRARLHTVCAMVWLGVKHAESALEGADCPHYEWLPLRMLRSRGENSLWGGSFFTSVPRSTCPASAEAELARAGNCRWIRWREWRRASPYLLPFPSVPVPALWDRNASDGWIPHRLGSGHGWPPYPWSTRPERSPCVARYLVYRA